MKADSYQGALVYSLDMGLGPFITFVQATGKVGGTAQILGQGLTWHNLGHLQRVFRQPVLPCHSQIHQRLRLFPQARPQGSRRNYALGNPDQQPELQGFAGEVKTRIPRFLTFYPSNTEPRLVAARGINPPSEQLSASRRPTRSL